MRANVKRMKAKRSTLNLLGVGTSRIIQARNKSGPRQELVGLGPRTVPYSAIEVLADQLHVPATDLCTTTGIPLRTALRRKQRGYFTAEEADRILRVAGALEDAVRVFGDPDKASRWLTTPHPLFSNATPLSLLDCHAGGRAVTDELTRIDFGDLA